MDEVYVLYTINQTNDPVDCIAVFPTLELAVDALTIFFGNILTNYSEVATDHTKMYIPSEDSEFSLTKYIVIDKLPFYEGIDPELFSDDSQFKSTSYSEMVKNYLL